VSTADVTARCACCPHRPADGYRTCDRCTDRLREALDDIAEYWPMVLDARLAPAKEPGRRAPGFASSVPIDVGRMAILTPDLVWSKPGDLHYPPAIMAGWGSYLQEELTGEPAYYGDPRQAARYLARNLGHVTRQSWVADLWPEVRDVAHQMASTVGVATRTLVGPCPTVTSVNDDDAETRCGTRLYAKATGDLIHCHACGESWQRPQWGRLRFQMAAASTPERRAG